MLRLFLSLCSTVFFLALVGAVVAGVGLWHFGKDLPDYRQLADYEPAITTRLYAGDGRLMSEYAVEKRLFVPISAIPRRVVDAFLSAEDQDFYRHPGFDLRGLVRAVITNIKNIGTDRRLVGASTITQQIAKNFLLTNEVSFERKIKEAILTLRIEHTFTKDHILELYLNDIYLGYGSYGVAAAALNYFNRTLDQLTIAEAAYLAAVPKAPNNYHPIRRRAAALERRNWVIMRMLEDGHIGYDEASAAMAEPLQVRSPDTAGLVHGADYFAEDVRRQIVSRYGEDSLYKGGLAVRTTLNPTYQHIANEALRDGLIAYDRRHGWRGSLGHMEPSEEWMRLLATFKAPKGIPKAWRVALVLKVRSDRADIGLSDGQKAIVPFSSMTWARAWIDDEKTGPKPRTPRDVVSVGDVILVGETEAEGIYSLEQLPEIEGGLVAMDPHTGRVLAMTGGFSSERSEFNRATQALRQPGSAFKPFVYLAALENGLNPSTLIMDAPFVYDQGPGLPPWKPKNYSGRYHGPTTLRVGLEKSRNLMTVRLAQAVGMKKISDIAETFGVDRNFPQNLASSLGAGETTVLRMTTAYAMFANGGKRITPTLIDRIQDRHGKTIYRHDQRPCPDCQNVFWVGQDMPDLPDLREQIADPRSIYQIVHILEGAVQYGTARRLVSLNIPVAGKTGTTNNSVDVWFIGFTPDLVVGVFIGFDEPRSLGPRETGSRVALPVFRNFMKEALRGQTVRPFRVPSGVQLIKVDHRTGRLASPGDERVVQEAFKVGDGPGLTSSSVIDGSAYVPGGRSRKKIPDTDPSFSDLEHKVHQGKREQPQPGGLY